MLNKSYQYVTNSKIFRLHGPSVDKAVFQKMLNMIVKSKIGRDLICRVGDACQKKGSFVVLKMALPKGDILGTCDSNLNVKIGNPCYQDYFPVPKEQAIFQQAMTLVHELGHVLQFLIREDYLNNDLPIKDRFYAQVWAEAEADLWARDVEMELSHVYPKLTQNMSLLKTRFKSRSDFVRSFFIKGCNYNWMSAAVDVVVSKLMSARKVVLPNILSNFYFSSMMNQRFQRMRLPLSYQDIPFDNCFWVSKLENGIKMVHNEDKYALIRNDGNLMAVCDQHSSLAAIKYFNAQSFHYLSNVFGKMPTSLPSVCIIKRGAQLQTKMFEINKQKINALVRQSDRFGG